MPAVELTVLISTYNHVGFIETAVDSVLMQETDFEYEIIISEDFSTDGTRDIVQRLAEAHPDRIRLCLSDRNLNDNTVMRRGFEGARGNYVALLDGDDFWTAKDKLQKQVDFLDENPACSTCFHNANVVYEGRPAAPHLYFQSDPPGTPIPKRRSSLADNVRMTSIPTCSVVVRADVARALPSWFDDLIVGDWPLYVWSAQHGSLAYLDDVMATYRVHAGGHWTVISSYATLADLEAVVRIYDVFNKHLRFEFDREISESAAALYEHRAVQFYKRGEYRISRICAQRALRRDPMSSWPRRWKSLAVLALSRLGPLAPFRWRAEK